MRGRIGTIVGWEYDEDEYSNTEGIDVLLSHVPRVVYVDFKDESWCRRKPEERWKFPHLEEGVYPIYKTKRTWYLDAYRVRPIMKVIREQIPLASAFAVTAHSAQGQTKKSIIADLVLGVGVSCMSSYVAITRVKTRQGLLIYRPFDRDPYTKGVAAGVDLFLKKMRKQTIQWEEVTKSLIPQKKCVFCNVT